MFQFPMTAPPCILAFFRIVGRRKKKTIAFPVESEKFGMVQQIKIKSAVCYLQALHIKLTIEFCKSVFTMRRKRLCLLFI